MQLLSNPPLPGMVLRVGITGHRQDRIAPDQLDRINNSLSEILLEVSAIVTRAHADFSDYYTQDAPVIHLVSPLADGADSMAAKIALAQGYKLSAPLPFPRHDYSRDFEEDGEKEFNALIERAGRIYELDGRRNSEREETTSYLAAGYMTLKQSDIMIAVWDGKGARGRGGTGMIVEASVQQDIPTIWINSETDEAPCILSEDLDYDRPLSALGDLIMHELAPPFVLDSDEDSSTQKIGADIFFQEVQQRHNFGIFYRLLESTMLKKWPRGLSFKREDYSARSESEWRPLANRMKAADVTSGDQDDEILFPRYCWADNLALHYADIYRSSYALNYLFSALAVFLALFGLIVGNKQIWIALEVMVILHILILTLRGKKSRWHERWIDYRQLAEQLRHLRYLHFAGGLSRESRLNPPADGGLQERSWVQWYYRSTVRELGMASAKCTDKFRSELTTAFVREELEPQVSYHEAKSVSLHKMEHAVHKIGEWVFGATLAICIMFLLLYVASKFDSTHKIADFLYSMNYIVTTATAFLPALGAAMFGIRVQGEFASTAQRSQAMSRRLFITHEQLSPHLEAAPPSMYELRSHIEMAAETMMIEITDWKFVYSSKPLSLPA